MVPLLDKLDNPVLHLVAGLPDRAKLGFQAGYLPVGLIEIILEFLDGDLGVSGFLLRLLQSAALTASQKEQRQQREEDKA